MTVLNTTNMVTAMVVISCGGRQPSARRLDLQIQDKFVDRLHRSLHLEQRPLWKRGGGHRVTSVEFRPQVLTRMVVQLAVKYSF
jgi:hypothetical protein